MTIEQGKIAAQTACKNKDANFVESLITQGPPKKPARSKAFGEGYLAELIRLQEEERGKQEAINDARDATYEQVFNLRCRLLPVEWPSAFAHAYVSQMRAIEVTVAPKAVKAPTRRVFV